MSIKTRELPSFDPFDIKKELVQLADNHFGVNNVDLYESGFLGYLIQSLTFLTSDMLYQNAMAYNEAFLKRSILPSSVTEIASQLDYKAQKTIPAEGPMTLAIPIIQDREMLIKIPIGANVVANNITYKVKNNYYVEKNSRGIVVTTQNSETGLVQNIPHKIEMINKQLCIIFNVTIWQIEIFSYEFVVENPMLYVFYEETVGNYNGQLYKIIVNAESEIYTEVSSIYQAKPHNRYYEVKIDNVTPLITIKFGNGIYGYQPKAGAEALITVYTTLGVDGNIIAQSAKLTERIVDNISGQIVNVESYNPAAINNGQDKENIEDMKRHTIENISAAKRLVTNIDYYGFQGVTGLTNFKALPVLKKRDVIGNHIDVFSVLFDDKNKPIPTNTIPLLLPSILEENNTVLKQGEEIIHDGFRYISPFHIMLDTTYDIPVARYYYSLTNLLVTPLLFSRNVNEDILMGLRQVQAKIFDNTDQIVFIGEIFKLAEMDAGKIHGVLQIQGYEDIELEFSQQYDDKVTVNISSSYLDSTALPTSDFIWTVKLYYGDRFYNTYQGEWKLFEAGKIIDTNIIATVNSSLYINSFLDVESIIFKVNQNTQSGYFEIIVKKLSNTDLGGNTINNSDINVNINILGDIYNANMTSVTSTRLVFTTQFINLSKFQVNVIEALTVAVSYQDTIYNEYSSNIDVLTHGRRFLQTIVNDKPQLIDVPAIELVHLGLNEISIKKIDNSYIFFFRISKMANNSANKISCKLMLENMMFDLSEDIMNEFQGELTETETDPTPNNVNSTVMFMSPPINSDTISFGNIPFKVELMYDGEMYSIYKQNTIFHYDLTEIIHSNVSRNPDDFYSYVWSVPVIEKEYYTENIDYLDQYIFNEFARLCDAFKKYKMLTDRVNLKFARTFGNISNVFLNIYNPIPAKSYSDDFNMNIIPQIKVKVYIKKDARNDIPSIIEECKNVLYTFLQLKSNFHTNIYRSEMARFLHDTVDDLEFCEILLPTEDLVFDFHIEDIPRPRRVEIYKYCPEFIWFDKNKIDIDISLM